MTPKVPAIDAATPPDSAAIGRRIGEEILAERRAARRRSLLYTWALRLFVLVVVIGVWWLASDRGGSRH
ncbi:hypothetical protein [Flexivirga alba]|uniref:ABC transporter permease n=1 Tax=Flexivirga alba TaxID=702742 RepID=A0ABW2AJV2_9MICO